MNRDDEARADQIRARASTKSGGFAAGYEDAKFFFRQARANASLSTRPKHAEMSWSAAERGWVIAIFDGSGEYARACRHCGSIGLDRDDHTCPCSYADADCPDHRGDGGFA